MIRSSITALFNNWSSDLVCRIRRITPQKRRWIQRLELGELKQRQSQAETNLHQRSRARRLQALAHPSCTE
ncbi:hypothetical protein M758_UG177600 [Ceratodon purpureus]|nr:hypothetical protein M758_UG177600 [Ceratodon purpureus]